MPLVKRRPHEICAPRCLGQSPNNVYCSTNTESPLVTVLYDDGEKKGKGTAKPDPGEHGEGGGS